MKALFLIHVGGYNVGTIKLFLKSGTVLQLTPGPFKKIPSTVRVAQYGGSYDNMKEYLSTVVASQELGPKYLLKEIEL